MKDQIKVGLSEQSNRGKDTLLGNKRNAEQDNSASYKYLKDSSVTTPEMSFNRLNVTKTPQHLNLSSENKPKLMTGPLQKYSSKSLKNANAIQNFGDGPLNCQIYSNHSIPPSHISVLSRTGQSKLLVSPYIIRQNPPTDDHIDVNVILKVIGGSLIAFGFVLTLNSFDIKELEQFITVNKHRILLGLIATASLAFIILTINFIESRLELRKKSKEMAKVLYKQLIDFYEQRHSRKLNCKLEEDSLIQYLAKLNHIAHNDIKVHIYFPFLKQMLELNPNFTITQYNTQGQLKTYWNYETINDNYS